MKNETEKKGLFARLNANKKTKKSSCCCCNIELEEIPDEKVKNEKEKEPPKDKGNSCCG